MTVRELIEKLKTFNQDMDVVDCDGYTFESVRFKTVIDSQYPHEELSHIAICVDIEENSGYKLWELKHKLHEDIYDYPKMYDLNGQDKWVKDILNYDEKYDNFQIYTDWNIYCIRNDGKTIYRLIDFAFFEPEKIVKK